MTQRCKEIYDWIVDFTTKNGYQPSIREIGAAFNIASPNGVTCHIKVMEKNGLVKRSAHSRSLIFSKIKFVSGATE